MVWCLSERLVLPLSKCQRSLAQQMSSLAQQLSLCLGCSPARLVFGCGAVTLLSRISSCCSDYCVACTYVSLQAAPLLTPLNPTLYASLLVHSCSLWKISSVGCSLSWAWFFGHDWWLCLLSPSSAWLLPEKSNTQPMSALHACFSALWWSESLDASESEGLLQFPFWEKWQWQLMIQSVWSLGQCRYWLSSQLQVGWK